jgi:hypothetical protein
VRADARAHASISRGAAPARGETACESASVIVSTLR